MKNKCFSAFVHQTFWYQSISCQRLALQVPRFARSPRIGKISVGKFKCGLLTLMVYRIYPQGSSVQLIGTKETQRRSSLFT